MRQRGLADAGQVFDQQVAARQQAGEGEADLLRLAEDDLFGLGDDGVQWVGHGAPKSLARSS